MNHIAEIGGPQVPSFRIAVVLDPITLQADRFQCQWGGSKRALIGAQAQPKRPLNVSFEGLRADKGCITGKAVQNLAYTGHPLEYAGCEVGIGLHHSTICGH